MDCAGATFGRLPADESEAQRDLDDRERARRRRGSRGRFRFYANPSTWSEWGHKAKWARAEGPLVEGATVDVKAGYGKVYPCHIRSLVNGQSLVLEARPPFMTVIQTYEVEPAAAGAHIRHALEISGPLAGITQLVRLDRVYQGWLDQEVGKLIEMARRPFGPADGHHP